MSAFNEKNGYWEYLWDNGQVYFKGNWEKGLMHGDWQSYYPTGRLLGSGCYKNGLRDGKFSSYHDNGNLECEGSFKDGKRIDVWGNDDDRRPVSLEIRRDVCDSFEQQYKRSPMMQQQIGDLVGKVLVCVCAPMQCHGDYLAEKANKHENSKIVFGG